MSIDPKKTPVTLLSQSQPSQGSQMSHGVGKNGCHFTSWTAFTRISIAHDWMNIFLWEFFWQLK